MSASVDLRHLRGGGERRMLSLRRGQTLFQEGERNDELYVIVKGEVALLRNMPLDDDAPALVAGPGEVVGEIGVFAETEQPFTASVVEDAVVWALPAEAALDLATRNARFGHALLQQLSRRVNLLARGRRGDERDATPAPADPPADSHPPSEMLGSPDALAPSPAAQSDPQPSDETATTGPDDRTIYRKAVNCPICSRKFDALNVRDKYVRVRRRDSDLCEHYEGVNPVYYAVYVCPNCYYAAYSDDFDEPTDREMASIRDALREAQAKVGSVDFHRRRDSRAAALSYELALISYGKRRVSPRKLAGIHHRLAWIARWDGDEARERTCLEAAVQGYATTYEHGDVDGPRSEIMLAYLLGDLSLRLGRLEDATRWLGRAMYHPDIGRFRRLQEMVRDEIDVVRQEKARRSGAP